jgi:polycomb protein EED
MDDSSNNNKKNSKKSRINDEEPKKINPNNNENVYDFLKEENKKALFDKLINNFDENFFVEQKLAISRQNQIPYFNFNEKPMTIEEECKENNVININEEYEIIKIGEEKEILMGNDIIYGLTIISHYVIAVSKEYMKMYDLKDENYKEVKSICVKDVFFYCVDSTKLDNNYYIVMGGNTNSIFMYTISVENNNFETNENIEELIGHKNDINDLKFLIKHPNILLSASSDSTVRVWDIKIKKMLCIYGGPLGHPSHVLTVDFHFSEKFIASAGFDQVVMFWDIDFVFQKYNNEEQTFKKCLLKERPFFETFIHQNYIDTVKFMGDLVLSKSTNGVILLWKPMFNDEKDHHFIIKKLFYTSSKIWYVKFHLNLVENLLFIGDVGGLYIFNLNNHKYSNAAMPDITAQIGSKSKSDILFRCVIYDNVRNLVITGKDDGKLCFARLVKMTNNANGTTS